MSSAPLSVTQLLAGPATDADQVRELLRDVLDPELGVDVVSLGLIYGIEVNGRAAAVLATTTTPACPLGEYISAEIEGVLLASGMVDHVSVQITHTPAWTRQMMEPAARHRFGWS